MAKPVQRAETRKKCLIDYLLARGIFKMGDKQLYMLPLSDLEKEYNQLRNEKERA
ncbi:Fur-regulated basic protein FbpA [Pseudalkalibacillus caeni]|uniref:Fur-regulated basic protein FbpA n=1 Tax=Exobacillus caeni TaxID=2574798 RepID=A0A5R9F7H6_9BACL|nr:Fur-regulated basic protein FbpA [Pseudalkalibacillus caeni]TLS37578.1 Fur-regulated basic protein FbpA [Pseudalkalibacillus caeni]